MSKFAQLQIVIFAIYLCIAILSYVLGLINHPKGFVLMAVLIGLIDVVSYHQGKLDKAQPE
jgi:hypothetical protein